MKTPFLSGAYVSRSTNVAADRCINLISEVVETKQGKDVGAFYGAPGLDLQVSIGTGPIRGGRTVGASAYAVSGNQVFQVNSAFVGTALAGTLSTSSGNVSLTDNGTQLLVSDGTSGYISTLPAGALSVVASFPVGGQLLAMQDGFGLTNIPGTQNWYQSNVNDLSVWGGANFAVANGAPQNLNSFLDVHREVWLFCVNATEVWINAGLANFAFQRLSGIFIQQGCVAAFSPAVVGENPCWLGQNEQGQAVAYQAKGYTEQRISTHAVEREWQGYSVVSDAIGFSYQQEGHLFYVLVFPTGDATWVYDATESEKFGFPLWHQRAAFANGLFKRHYANCAFFFAGKNIVGDYRNGNLYSFNLATATDNTDTRKWLRAWRALPPGKQQYQPVRFEKLQIDCQTGIGVADGADPLFMLRFSNDGGHRWSSELFAKAGATGETGKRVQFKRLGSTRKNSGLDRVFELSSTDAVQPALIGAELDAEPT